MGKQTGICSGIFCGRQDWQRKSRCPGPRHEPADPEQTSEGTGTLCRSAIIFSCFLWSQTDARGRGSSALCERHDACIRIFHRDLRSRVGQRSSIVRISATEGLTKHWLLPRVKKLRDLNNRIHLKIVSTIHQQGVAASDLDFVIRMGDPGESELIGKRVANVSMGLFASEEYLAAHPAPRSLEELKEHDIIGTASDFPVLQSERVGQMPLMTHYRAAADARSVLRVMPLANHFAAASEGLGLALLAISFALAENLVRVLPQESTFMNVWLLRRRESELRRLTREVRRFLESEFAHSKGWFSGEQRNRKSMKRKG